LVARVVRTYTTGPDADTIDKDMSDELERAVRFATESPYPAPEETLEDVYA